MTHPVHPDFPGLHIMPVHVTNAAEIAGGQAARASEGYPRSTWVTHSAPLFGQGVTPVQLLKSDERRGRAVFFSIDQDIYVASTEPELILSAGQALPQGGYVPKGLVIIVYDSDPLYAVSAASGASKVTVHAESAAD